ncbi:hypothetical protein [Streptomyces canus]|uniref:hypothetical protein n=1 Tax=Streptomyces canus TaxID=58343 RepID=UPI003869AC80|nr:hypothetical protein OH837_00005 [Streptomyces canus]WSZ55063.1 hypothetical protein OH824_00010 [Streptomyces canus]WSZ63847.1 hypothetical protein OH824_48810 [Streptomyces canus]
MSDSELPRQHNAPVDASGQMAFPPMPPRWDDPPTSISEPDLMRMTPGECNDEPLLDAVSDALWEPVDLHEPPHVQHERLKSITEEGARLREKWAETAALEEAYAAPSTTLRERRRAAQERKLEQMAARMRCRRRRQLVGVSIGVIGVIALTVCGLNVFAAGSDNASTWSTKILIPQVLLMSLMLYRAVDTIIEVRRIRAARRYCRRLTSRKPKQQE